MQAQLATHVAQSYNFYPPKVYNLSSNASALDPHSGNQASTWPFYLEAYTAAAAMQAGYYEDGLAVIEQIGLVNLRLGLGWAQNLWNPGFLTYVTAPVTWFVPDVMGGFALDVPAKTLYLAPVVPLDDKGAGAAVLPMFFPAFWATVTASTNGPGSGQGSGPGQAAGKLRLTITKTFGEGGSGGGSGRGGGGAVVITQVTAQPAGVPTAAGKTVVLDAPFACVEGAVLVLDQHWDTLVAARLRPRVLPGRPPTGRAGP